MFKLNRIALSLPLLFSLSACEGEEGRPVYPSYDQTIWELAMAQPDLSRFLEVAALATLDAPLQKTQASYTVLAPSNAAFTAAGELTDDPDELHDLMFFHTLAGTIDSSLLKIGGEFRTITATTVRIEPSGSSYTVTDSAGNTAMFTTTDLYASNGVLHVIDKVLTPPPEEMMPPMPGSLTEELTAAHAEFATLLTDTEAGTAIAGDGPFTVFAPADAAITALDLSMASNDIINNILLHHVVAESIDAAALAADPTPTTLANLPLEITGGGMSAGGADVAADGTIEASNGFIHGLSEVITPPTSAQYLADTMRQQQTTMAVDKGMVTGLNPDTLGGDMPVTIFAPINSAWDSVDIAMASTATVAAILEAHAVEGQFTLDELLEMDGMSLTTLGGSTISIAVSGMTITLTSGMNSAEIINDESNVRTLSGVVHAIDMLLSTDGSM